MHVRDVINDGKEGSGTRGSGTSSAGANVEAGGPTNGIELIEGGT